MVEEKFKLPDSSYEELAKIIMAYGRSEKAVSLEEVTRISGVPRTIVSSNNGFLLSGGIIEGGKAKAPTSMGIKLARALEHERPEEIQGAWQEVINSSDFLMKMLAAIKIRRGMDSVSLQGHIAYSAGEPRTRRTSTGTKAIVDILRASGLVQEEDGRIVATEQPEPIPPIEKEQLPTHPEALKTSAPHVRVAAAGPAISVHIEIQVQAKPSELDGLGTKLRQVIEEFSTSSKPEGESASTPES